MVDIFKHNFQLIFPALPTIFPLFLLPMFILPVLLYYFMFPPQLPLFLYHVQTFLNIQILHRVN